MSHPLLKYSFPAAILAGLGGFFVGSTMDRGHQAMQRSAEMNPREAFLSSEDDVVDYTKLARVCLAAAQRKGGNRGETETEHSVLAEPGDPEVESAKQSLDEVMAISLQRGVWSRGSGLRARLLMKKLPQSDIADFESLLETTVQRGDLTVRPGAWVPRSVN